MMAVGFRCGIGNFIIFSSILQSLAHHSGSPVDLVLDDSFVGSGADSIRLLARYSSYIRSIVGYPSSFERSNYDAIYMSRHSILLSEFFQYAHGVDAIKHPIVPNWYISLLHERDFYLFEIQKQFQYKGPIFPQFMPTTIPSHARALGIGGGPVIVIANGFKRSRGRKHLWERKIYPHFPELVETIHGYYPEVKVCLVGGAEDKEWASSFVINDKTQNLCGELNTMETAWVVEQSSFVITNDSFVAHCADALCKPGIMLFGPTLVSKNGPLNGTMRVLSSPHPCAPCQGRIDFLLCKNQAECMKAIPPDAIMAVMREML